MQIIFKTRSTVSCSVWFSARNFISCDSLTRENWSYSPLGSESRGHNIPCMRLVGKPSWYVAGDPGQLSLVILCGSISESWGVNSHTVRGTSHISVVSQHRPVCGRGIEKQKRVPPLDFVAREDFATPFTNNCSGPGAAVSQWVCVSVFLCVQTITFEQNELGRLVHVDPSSSKVIGQSVSRSQDEKCSFLGCGCSSFIEARKNQSWWSAVKCRW